VVAKPGSAPPALPVNGVVVKPSAITQEIFATGSVLANEAVDLHPEVSGKLLQIFFKEGSNVKKGELLIKINDADLQAQLHKNQLDVKLADDRIKRNEKLLEMKGISQEEFDALQNTVASLNADRDELQAQIAKTEIRAPFNGLIGLKTVSEGSYVTPQTMIASLQQIDPVKVDFSIPEKYSSMVKRGDEIVFTVGSSNKNFTGNIYAIEPKVDDVTRTVQIRALCPNANSEVLPGAFARVTLRLSRQDNALMIPTESIVPVLKGKQVYVSRGGKAEAVMVEAGVRNDSTIQITKGLSENDTVITTGVISLRPGVAVKLTSVK
jgi:membrane fusion protein (multidrug efflux system)